MDGDIFKCNRGGVHGHSEIPHQGAPSQHQVTGCRVEDTPINAVSNQVVVCRLWVYLCCWSKDIWTVNTPCSQLWWRALFHSFLLNMMQENRTAFNLNVYFLPMLKTVAELDPPEPQGKSSTLGTSQVWAWSHCTKGEIRGVPTGTGYFTSGQRRLASTLMLKRCISKD